MSINIYTDGACKGNPGKGGWGAWLVHVNDETGQETDKELFGGERDTTNNRMELTAVIKGLQALTRPCEVKIVTDSKYVLQGVTEWMKNWKKNGWKTAAKKPVQNKELWIALDDALQQHKVEWEWVKGHAGHEGNERADDLANRGVDSLR